LHFLSQYSHIWVKFRKFGEFRPIKTERRNAPIKKRSANLSSAYFICPGSRIKVFANPDPKRRFSPMCRFLSTSTLVLVLQPRGFSDQSDSRVFKPQYLPNHWSYVISDCRFEFYASKSINLEVSDLIDHLDLR